MESKFNLKEFRERLGLSQVELAGILGVGERSVYNWEVKGTMPRNREVALKAIFADKITSGSAKNETSVAAGGNAQVTVNQAQQHVLDNIMSEVSAIKELLQGQIAQKDSQISKLLEIISNK